MLTDCFIPPDVSPCQPRLKTLSSLPKNKTPEYLRCGFSPVSRCASLCLRCCHVSSGGPLSVHMFILQSLWQRLRINTWEGDGLHALRILLISFHRRHSSLAEELRASESKKKKKQTKKTLIAGLCFKCCRQELVPCQNQENKFCSTCVKIPARL